MGKSVSKIRHIQEMNEKLEEKFLFESKMTINENWWNRVWANARGFGSRFVSFGRNLSAVFGGGTAQNPALNAAKARIEQRSKNLIRELNDFQDDLNKLFSSEDFAKVQRKSDKLNDRGDRTAGDQIENKLDKFQEEINDLMQSAESIKGFVQGFINQN